MILGLDYASVDENSSPDFLAARRWGARFAMIRTAYTSSSVARIDDTWARDHAAARSAGLQVAPYLILGWSVDTGAQVQQLVTAYGRRHDGDLPVALDVEGVPGMSAPQAIAKIETTVTALRHHYRTVMIYTSCAVWEDRLGDLPSEACGACPLWLKVGYPWRAHNPPHLESIPPVKAVPRPWRAVGSPGAFIEQFQGDAIHVPGFSSTVDLDVFLPYFASTSDSRTTWIRAKLAAAGIRTEATTSSLSAAIHAFQAARQLSVDGVIGPATWAELCAV